MPRLTADELRDMARRAERYDGPYTPTYQGFARDILRLIAEVERLCRPWWRWW